MNLNNPEQLIPSISQGLQKFLPFLPGQDTNVISELISQKIGDIIDDIKDEAEETIAENFEDIGTHDPEFLQNLSQDMEQQAASHDTDISDILGEHGEQPPREPSEQTDGELPEGEEMPEEQDDEDTDAQEEPEHEGNADEQPEQDYNPFPESEDPQSSHTADNPQEQGAPEKKQNMGERLLNDTLERRNNPQKQVALRSQLNKLTMSRSKAVRNASKPYQKKLKDIKEKLDEIDSTQSKLKRKMSIATLWFGFKMIIASIILILGALLTIIIITAFIGFPMVTYAGEMMLSSLATYGADMARYIKEYADTREEEKKKTKEKKEQEKKLQEVQAQANKSFAPRIQKIQQALNQ